jgi:tRNA pseudouridine38-40 synthase
MRQRYFIKLAYNGTNYHGWQRQENALTIQEVIETGLSLKLGEDIRVMGAGRTDTGVHAEEFFAHFDHNDMNGKLEQLVYSLNAYFPADIVICDIFKVKPDMHARFSAISRTYEYRISRLKDPFNHEFVYHYSADLDIDLINRGAEILFDYEDFTSFSKLHTQVRTNNCKMIHAKWEMRNDLLVFTITADRFLRNMVRAIVGTLLDLGKHKIDLSELRKIIENKNRSDAGFSVPAKGLFLTAIEYPGDIRV